MTEAQTLLAAIIVLMLREIFGAYLSRSKQTALAVVGAKVDALHGKVEKVESNVTTVVAPATAKADEAMGVANQAVTMLNAMSSAFMPLIEGQKVMIASLLAEIATNRGERERLKVEIENRDATIHEKELKIDTYMAMTDNLTADLGVMQSQIQERDKASGRRDEQLVSLQQQVNDVNKEQEKARKELENTQSELEQTKAKLEVAERRIRDLEKELREERAASENEKARLKDQLKAAHVEVEKLRARVNELEDQVRALQAGQKSDTAPPSDRPVGNNKENS